MAVFILKSAVNHFSKSGFNEEKKILIILNTLIAHPT